MPNQTPRTIATIGLHGSASTWVFNVVREIMIASFGREQVLSIYADRPKELADDKARAHRHLVIKSHQGSPGLDAWLQDNSARMVLSVRDPRDACVSMAQRFGVPLQHTVPWVLNDCTRLTRLVQAESLLLRYEERFFDDAATVERLAEACGVQLSSTTIDAIFGRYRTEAVRSFAEGLPELSPERLTRIGSFMMDRVTHILGPHIGDARSGKWRDLPPSAQATLTDAFGPFLEPLGYAA